MYLLQTKNTTNKNNPKKLRSLTADTFWEYPVSWTSITILLLILFIFIAILPRIDDKPLLAHKQIVWKLNIYDTSVFCFCFQNETPSILFENKQKQP